ncbi:MAG: hypothetical protein ACFFDN_47525, partial [Candidatus Hodarchaeota archaeon]
ESSKYSQDYVFINNWFDSKHFLISYADDSKTFPKSEQFESFFKFNNFYIEDIEFIKHSKNRYAFK